MYTPGQVTEVKVQSAERAHTNNLLVPCADIDTGSQTNSVRGGRSAPGAHQHAHTHTHQTCTLTIYPVCFAWIHSSHHRRRSWPCRPSPGRSPLWTPHRSGRTSRRCHRTGRCWENPAGQTDRRSARESNRDPIHAEFMHKCAADEMPNICLEDNHDQHKPFLIYIKH